MNSIAKIEAGFTIFKFDEKDVRVVDKGGDPWFLAADLVSVLNLDITAVRKLDDDEKGLHLMQTPGGMQDVSVVSEAGMYTLILRCRDAIKPGTVPYRVRKWVTGEVLPAIRKTGSYQAEPSVPAIKETKAENRYRVRVIIYDEFFGGGVEFHGLADTFRGIATGISTDLGYKPHAFTHVGTNKEKMRRIY